MKENCSIMLYRSEMFKNILLQIRLDLAESHLHRTEHKHSTDLESSLNQLEEEQERNFALL
ncbi:hypothetical protein EOD39_16506 [Acipenser ruthenus]|uniref:Uncharacterized protein n=1 Tax=Acipenser ruthenus TaxID=7906 RepID=A0A444V5R5_ACIRT|nr:hypothetical protein EOD39_16506 [Acipenser ruthenus]